MYCVNNLWINCFPTPLLYTMMMIMTTKISTRVRKPRHTRFFSKTHLSYSKIALWKQGRKQFVDTYFIGKEKHDTPELLFGKMFAEKLERGDTDVAHIPRYELSEYKLQCKVDGIPCLGFIDSLKDTKDAFLEYKTGRVPWDAARVNGHLQLDMYSLMLQEMFGVPAEDTRLIWIETKKKEIVRDVMGYEHRSIGKDIELTGEIHEFHRIVTQDDRDMMKRIIKNVANEIEEEWRRFKARSTAQIV